MLIFGFIFFVLLINEIFENFSMVFINLLRSISSLKTYQFLTLAGIVAMCLTSNSYLTFEPMGGLKVLAARARELSL
jgi:hypothetical protein